MHSSGSGKVGGIAGGRRFQLGLQDGCFSKRWGWNCSVLRSFGGLAFGVWRRGSLDFGGRLNGFRSRNRMFDWLGRRLDHHGNSGRRCSDSRTRRGSCDCRSLGDYCLSGRTGGNGGRRWLGDNGRRGAWLGYDLARFRLSRCCGRFGGNCNHRCRTRRLGDRLGGCSLHRQTALTRGGFLFLLLGQYSLQHVAGLGNMREINLRRNGLRSARGWCACRARGPRAALKMSANLFGFIFLQRAGVGLACAQAEFRQYIKNLPALDFHLAREIVDTNLTHPPLFKICCPKPLVAHSYLMALAVLKTAVIL
jgi:hypothetical protein